jgi:hypothetical protein
MDGRGATSLTLTALERRSLYRSAVRPMGRRTAYITVNITVPVSIGSVVSVQVSV